MPTSLVMMDKSNETSIIFSRLSVNDRNELISLLPKSAEETGLNVRCIIPEGYRLYNWDLFQRLLTADGSWDSDVSGLISQVRSAPKHIKDEVMKELS